MTQQRRRRDHGGFQRPARAGQARLDLRSLFQGIIIRRRQVGRLAGLIVDPGRFTLIQDTLERAERIQGPGKSRIGIQLGQRLFGFTDVSAIQAALGAFNKELLSEHIKSCVVHDIREGDDAVVDELVTLLAKMVR